MKFRLLKVMCVAVLITEDEDGGLIEHTSQPVAVVAKEWLDYPRKMMDEIATLNMEQEYATRHDS